MRSKGLLEKRVELSISFYVFQCVISVFYFHNSNVREKVGGTALKIAVTHSVRTSKDRGSIHQSVPRLIINSGLF